ncbi:MAG: hypothetical protein ACKPKO_17110, partial [Candidatus Fonsibacter sp.]
MDDFTAVISRDSESGYTTAINLFWCESFYSPTPGIPIRADTIPDLVECNFKAPSAMPRAIQISLSPSERPLDKRGALLAINP